MCLIVIWVIDRFIGGGDIGVEYLRDKISKTRIEKFLHDTDFLTTSILVNYCISMLAKMSGCAAQPELDWEIRELFETSDSRRYLTSLIQNYNCFWIISSFTFSNIKTFESGERFLGDGLIGSMRLNKFD